MSPESTQGHAAAAGGIVLLCALTAQISAIARIGENARVLRTHRKILAW